MLILIFFFFSSRRRHTRSLRDWSSDVCSSDLGAGRAVRAAAEDARRQLIRAAALELEIGRASCRERVYISVVAVSLKKKQKKPKNSKNKHESDKRLETNSKQTSDRH